ncbi:MAG: peptidoglycan DD-metalloendopeptidase family protein [Clostridia bacterium]|nr:peptidoglycan DD-metalloendopeptidase family protein [Clostridia bacterium]
MEIIMKFNKKAKSIIAAFCSVSVLFSFTNAFAAKSVSDLKKEMQERNEQIKQKEKEINSKKAEQDAETQKRNNLDLQISAMLDDISDAEEIIDEKQKEIDEKNAEIDTLNSQIEENNERLKQRIKVMYEYGTTSYLQLLLESNGLADLVTRLSVVKSVYNYDKDVINTFVDSKQRVEEAKQLVVNEQNEQIEAKSILESKKSDLEKLKSEKQAIIDSLNNDIKSLEKEEKQIENDYNDIQNELKKALEAEEAKKKASSSGASTEPAYKGNGKFGWPSAASSNITSNYGYRIHPISGTKRLHRGIDISAPLGSNVLAAEAGTVVTAGFNNSYGYYVTINHGGGYVTLYAHNSKLLVSAGQKVNKGDVIAKCGSTGSSTGNHVHFEVIVNGSPKNPLNYL